MSWSQAMRESRRHRQRQPDFLDEPLLAYRLVCNSEDPLTNEMVTARKLHDCFTCRRSIVKGERVRRETRRSQDGNKIETRHVCQVCCKSILEGGQPWASGAS